MTTRRFRQGDVLSYPYRFTHQPSAILENPKDRPACISLMLKGLHGNVVLTLLPISDKPPQDAASALELSSSEIAAIGLSDKRRAFIHVSEANVDDVNNSLTIHPKTRILGRLPEPTLRRMLTLLKAQLLAKNIHLTKRGKQG